MGRRILVIDDERDMQVYLQTLFRRAGYEAQVAADGEHGVALVRSFRPELVTLDILMPKRSGISVYQAIRQTAEGRDVPVIVLTGVSNHDQLLREIGELTPPAAIVDKPIERESFLRRVQEILGGDA